MKASLIVTAALACTLASAASAQQSGVVQPAPTKSGARAPQTKAGGQINLSPSATKSTTGPSSSVNPRPGGFVPVVGGAAETCAGATVIAGPGTFVGNNLGAALETQVNCAAAAEVGDVWYSWTAGSTGSQVMTFCVLADAAATADFDTLLAVYAGACGGTMLACNDDGPGCDPGPGTGTVPGDWTSTVQFGVTAGNVYKLQIAGFDAATGFGNYSLVIKPVVARPAGDSCATPLATVAGAGPHAFDNTHATTGNSTGDVTPAHQTEAACNQFGVTGINADLWVRWTAGFTASARLRTCVASNPSNPAEFDTKLAVYSPGAGCPAGAPLACNDDTCGLKAQVDFPATAGSIYRIQMGTYPGGVAGDQGIGVFGGPGTFDVIPTPTGPPNDDCATPAATLFGPGPHNFDTSTANTGTQGQAEPLCQSNPGGMPINNDQWFKWSASGTGQATLTTCGLTTVDTKIAVYPPTGSASACPTAPAIGCNDDNCPAALQSSLCFPATLGQLYVIQMGTFPGATGGAGQFGITIGASGVTACKRDDGVSDDMLGWNVGGDMAWLSRFDLGVSSGVSSIQVAWGSAAFPGASPIDGSPARVLLYEDPNNDGDPSDLVLKQNVATTVANVDTDILNSVSVPSTDMAGVFFAGAAELHAAGQFVAVMDQTCPIDEETFFFGDNAAVPATNYANPSASPIPIDSFLNNGFPCNLLVRVCGNSAQTTFCEPGTAGVIPCPCGNAPTGPGRGCNNSAATGGAALHSDGVAQLSADTLVFKTTGQMVTGTSFLLQGTTEIANGVMFGDGVRCLGGTLSRLYTKNATAGQITAPQGSDRSVSERSRSVGDPIFPGQMRYYTVVYRDPVPAFGCPNPGSATFNTSSSKRILWPP